MSSFFKIDSFDHHSSVDVLTKKNQNVEGIEMMDISLISFFMFHSHQCINGLFCFEIFCLNDFFVASQCLSAYLSDKYLVLTIAMTTYIIEANKIARMFFVLGKQIEKILKCNHCI